MIEFLKQLPHLEHYGTPIYFVYLILAFCRSLWALFFKKEISGLWRTGESDLYHFDADRFESQANWCPALLRSLANLDCVFLQNLSSESGQQWTFYLHSFLSVLPLIFVKVGASDQNGHQSLFGFLGISYLTFRAVRWSSKCEMVSWKNSPLGILTLYALYADLLKWTDWSFQAF